MTNVVDGESRDWTQRTRCKLMSLALAAAIVFLPLTVSRLVAQDPVPTYSVLHSFANFLTGSLPAAGLIADSSGNLYGTTSNGGIFRDSCFGGCGIVFKLDPLGNETVLYKFTGGADGAKPFSDLVMDSEGNLYGTTNGGGMNRSPCPKYSYGCGVVFKLDTMGHESVLHTFGGIADGASPVGGLVRDAAGNLYGTTAIGSHFNSCSSGCGIVFMIGSDGQHYNVLHGFTGGADGANPEGGVILDSDGNLYGATEGGGNTSSSCPAAAYGCGVVFKLDPLGNETVLYAFAGGARGWQPRAGLIRDAAGNLYGTTFQGGPANASCGNFTHGCGVVFKVDTLGNEAVVYSFTGGADGAFPLAGLIRDSVGNLYGTTVNGGNGGRKCSNVLGCGVVFMVDPLGNETVLHSFTAGMDGSSPEGGLLQYQGWAYGMANSGGGHDGGVVFKVQP